LFKDLQKLKNGESIESPIYDFENHTRSKFKNIINPRELIVVEGIFVFYFKNIRKLLDISIFIDTPSKIRYKRRLERDIKNRGRTKDSIEKQYFTMVKPMYNKFIEPYKKFSNFVISHNQKSELSFNSLFNKIENLKKGEMK
jgi:uridine kinase